MLTLKPTKLRGFTLIEVLVALAILVASLGFIYEILTLNRQRVEEIATANKGLIIAQSKLAEYAESQIQAEGGIDGYTWQITISNYEPVGENFNKEARARNPLKLVKVEVRVAWPSGLGNKKIELTTLRPAKGGTP